MKVVDKTKLDPKKFLLCWLTSSQISFLFWRIASRPTWQKWFYTYLTKMVLHLIISCTLFGKKTGRKTSLGEQNTEKLYSGLVWDSKVISIISNFIIFHAGGMKKRKRDTTIFDLVCYITRIDLISVGFCSIIFTYRRHRGFPPWLCLHTSRNTSSPLAQFPASRSKRQTNGWLAIACIIRTWFNTPKFSGHQSPS